MQFGPYDVSFENGFEKVDDDTKLTIFIQLSKKYDFVNDIIPNKFRQMECQFQQSGKYQVSSPDRIIFKYPEFTDSSVKVTGILVAEATNKKQGNYHMGIGKFNVLLA